ncbi:MAG TPA: YsnF/AvaK domain-containing protein [Nitrososphaeraceae archaeon]
MDSDSKNIPWHEIIKKDAVGINHEDFGKIQEVGSVSILTKKGFLNIEFFDLPKDLIASYDGDRVYFKLNEEEARKFSKRNSSLVSEKEEIAEESYINQSKITAEDENNNLSTDYTSIDNKNNDIVIPLMSEELVVTKKEVTDEVIITKKPVTETKTEQVQLMHEEIRIERRPVNNSKDSPDTSTTKEDIPPIESKTEIKIPLKREEVKVTKKPYVKEEIIVKRQPVTEIRKISEEIITEQIVEPGNV